MVHRILILLVIIASGVLLTRPSFAVDLEEYRQKLIELNADISMYQDINQNIESPITSSDAQNIGTVQDFLINEHGEVAKVISHINDTGMGKTTLELDYSELSQSAGVYVLASKAAEIEEELATYLSNIETAAGGVETQAIKMLSTRNLPGRDVTTSNGKKIASVKEILTDQNSQKVVGILISDTHGDNIILPYPSGLYMRNTGFEHHLELNAEYAEVLAAFQKSTAE